MEIAAQPEDLINISFQKGFELKSVSVYNDLGQLVIKYKNLPENCCAFNLDYLVKGLYNISIETKNEIINKHLQIN